MIIYLEAILIYKIHFLILGCVIIVSCCCFPHSIGQVYIVYCIAALVPDYPPNKANPF